MFGSYPTSQLDYADRSYVVTRLLWFTGLFIDSAVNGHRTVELFLKAFLASKGEKVTKDGRAWGHDLSRLGEVAVGHDRGFAHEDVARRIRFFERYFHFVRYPSDPGSPQDGSLTWFAFDANISPLDELVAFIRPRIELSAEDWESSVLRRLHVDQKRPHQRRALLDSNAFIETIDCGETHRPEVAFSQGFTYDLPGC